MAQVLSLRLSLRKILRALAVSIAVAALTASAAFIAFYLLYPVTGVEVKGARAFPESEARKAVSSHASLISLNSELLRERVESNPWVKGAKVTKDWDSGIVTVEVEERKAVLDADVDGRRVALAADGTELPGFGGAVLTRIGLDEVQLEGVAKIGEALEKNGVVLDSVDAVDAGGVEATVEGRRVLFADGPGSYQVRALKSLVEEHGKAPYFDLRSPERVVVGAEPGGDSQGSPGSG